MYELCPGSRFTSDGGDLIPQLGGSFAAQPNESDGQQTTTQLVVDTLGPLPFVSVARRSSLID
jgi:hypothetical protein